MADANRIGLKYLAGCQEEYCGGYFTGIDGYPDAAAVGRSGEATAGQSTPGCCRLRDLGD